MAEARIDEEEEELRELREPGVRRNLRQTSPATGRSERNKPERRLSGQGPLSSIRSAIKRTSTRTNSPREQSRERRRPEITILSAEPLATNAWFPGASAGFPPPPPPTEHIWGGTIPAAAQPPPSYDQVIREKTQEQAPPLADAPRHVTSTIATQTDYVPEAEASELQCSVASQAVEKKKSPGGRPSKPPRPFFPFMPKGRPSDTAANSSESPLISLSEEQTVTKAHTAEAVNNLVDTSCGFLPCPLTPASDLQAQPCEPCLISLDFPPASTTPSPPLAPSKPTANSQPKEEARRPTPRPRSKPTARDVKIQTLVRLRDNGESVQENQSGGEALGGKYLQELLDAFGSGDQFLSNQSDQSEESDQSETNDLGDQSEDVMLKTKIQAFEKQGGVDDVNGEPVKRPEPRPRAQHPKLPPPVAARPALPCKPSLPPMPTDKASSEEASTPAPRPETNDHKEPAGAPTPAPRPLLPKKSPTENENKEVPAKLARPPRPSVAARPKNPVARDDGCAVTRPPPPVQSKAVVDLLDLSSPPTVTAPPETVPDCDNSITTPALVDVPSKQEEPIVTIPDRPSVPQKPTVIRVSSKTGKSGGDGSAEPAPPLPAQNPVGGLAPPVVQKSGLASKSSAQPPAQESTNPEKPEGCLPLPPRPPGSKVLPPRPPPAKMPPGRPPPPQTAGHKRSQSKGALKKGPPLPPRPCPGHLLYNSYSKKNGTQVTSERKSSLPECHPGDVLGQRQSALRKTSAPLIDLSSCPEPQTSGPTQACRESTGLQAQVLHDFTPEGPNELALKVGDVVSMVEKVDSEWYRGTCKGSSGIFPVNHVKTLTPSPASGKKEGTVAAVVSGPRCVARFDYVAEQSDELSFSVGTVIRLKEHVDQEWVRGEVGGRTGIFPRNFVEVLEDLPSVPQSIQQKTEIADPTGLTTSLQNQEAAKSCQSVPAEEEWALALFDFTAQTDEDLSFKQGARILITEHVDSEWCCGRLDGKEGLFPKAFVQINLTGGGCNNQSGIHR